MYVQCAQHTIIKYKCAQNMFRKDVYVQCARKCSENNMYVQCTQNMLRDYMCVQCAQNMFRKCKYLTQNVKKYVQKGVPTAFRQVCPY